MNVLALVAYLLAVIAFGAVAIASTGVARWTNVGLGLLSAGHMLQALPPL